MHCRDRNPRSKTYRYQAQMPAGRAYQAFSSGIRLINHRPDPNFAVQKNRLIPLRHFHPFTPDLFFLKASRHARMHCHGNVRSYLLGAARWSFCRVTIHCLLGSSSSSFDKGRARASGKKFESHGSAWMQTLIPWARGTRTMGRSVSSDLRLRIVRGVAAGETRRAAAARLEVAPSTAVRIQARYARTGSMEPAKQGRTAGPASLGRIGSPSSRR